MESKKHAVIREPFSGLSHMVGAALSIAALVVLLVAAKGRPWQTVAFAIYGASLIVLYTSSALYHSLNVGPKALRRLQKMDHISIYILIAGSFTPLCLIAIRGGWGWSMLGVEYALAVIGIVLIASLRRNPKWLRTAIYVAMGWLAVIAFGPLRAALPASGLAWLVGGGIVYTLGVVCYATKRPRLWPGVIEGHGVWHVLVMVGSLCHFILFYSCLT